MYRSVCFCPNTAGSDADVTIVSVGGNGVRLASLQGQVDGTLLSVPHNKAAVKIGFRELFLMKDLRVYRAAV
jgi:ABC-type nitrate/sulfonate/bicarbonate transport system substrate-binding protein